MGSRLNSVSWCTTTELHDAYANKICYRKDSDTDLREVYVLNRLIFPFPNVDVVRSHSLSTSSRLKALFRSKNFSVESSFITHGTQRKFPNFWTEWNGKANLHRQLTAEETNCLKKVKIFFIKVL